MRWGLLVSALLLAAPAWGEDDAPSTDAAAPEAQTEAAAPVPEIGTAPALPAGWIAVPEDDWERLRDEPTLRFRAAAAHLEAGHPAGAAREVRRGAAFVRIEAARAPNLESRANLDRVTHELEALADGLAHTAEPEPPDDFDETIARAHHALAVSHAVRAQQRWESEGESGASATGAELEAAADHLEEAVSWSDRLKGGAVATVDRTRRLAGGLVRADAWAIEQVGNVIGGIGRQMGQLGKTLQGGHSDPARTAEPSAEPAAPE